MTDDTERIAEPGSDDEWPPGRARSFEDWDAYWARQRWDRRFVHHHVSPLWYRLRRRVSAPVRGWWLARHAMHRARHGWSARDTWSLDGYLCRVIGESVAHLRDHGHGYPHEPDPDLPDIHVEIEGEPGSYTNYLTPERWAEIQTRICDPLLAYRQHEDWPDGLPADEQAERINKFTGDAQDALRLLADWLPDLWD